MMEGEEMVAVKYFRATKDTKRFKKNQKVWIVAEGANHCYIKYKYRGKGRYVNGEISTNAKCFGEIKTIDVVKSFADRLNLPF
jgi:hypothetical protein